MLYLLAFALTVIGPILLAWVFGDQVIDFVSGRRRKMERRRRRRATSSLPVREEVLKTLLDVEERRDLADDRVAEALARYREMQRSRRIDVLSARHPATGVEGMEQILLRRESRFNAFLDLAWMQSEAIEHVTKELQLLRDLADLPATGAPGKQGARPSSTEQLLDTLNRATKRRQSIDRRIRHIGSAPAATRADRPPPPGSETA